MMMRMSCAALMSVLVAGCSGESAEMGGSAGAEASSAAVSAGASGSGSGETGAGGAGTTDETSSGEKPEAAAADGLTSTGVEGSSAADPPSDPGAIVESQVLRKELQVLAVEMLRNKSPEMSETELQASAEQMTEGFLSFAAKKMPGLLQVTAQREQDLALGKVDPEVDGRIEAAAKTTEELQMEMPELTKQLLAESKQKELSPVRKELLAQLLEGPVKRVLD